MSYNFNRVVLGYDSQALHKEAAHSPRLFRNLGHLPHVVAFLAFLSYYRFLPIPYKLHTFTKARSLKNRTRKAI